MNNRTRVILRSRALTMIAFSLWGLGQIPADARVPIHWDLEGNPNGWGARGQALWTCPLLTMAITLVIGAAMKLDPRQDHVDQSQKALNAVYACLAVFMAAIHGALVMAAAGHPVAIALVGQTKVSTLVFIPSLILSLTILVAYSYQVWRSDPNRS